MSDFRMVPHPRSGTAGLIVGIVTTVEVRHRRFTVGIAGDRHRMLGGRSIRDDGRMDDSIRMDLPDGYTIDSDRDRLDLARVHAWLSEDAYWAKGRSSDAVTRAAAASVNLGVYSPDGDQVGYGRIVTDGVTFGWLADVYIAPDARGRGLGTAIAHAAADFAERLGLKRMLLATADAHGVYAKAGFGALANPEWFMARM